MYHAERNEYGRRLPTSERFVPRDPESINGAFDEGYDDALMGRPQKEADEFEGFEEFDSYLSGYESVDEGEPN